MKRLNTTMVFATFACFLSYGTAHSETLDDLKGLSIKTVFNMQNKVKELETNQIRMVTFRHDRSMYVSLSGRIFQYNLASLEKIPRLSIAELDKAYRRSGMYENELYTWTFIGGHLSVINQFVRGFRVVTYAIEPATLTCNVYARDEADPVTHSIVGHSMKDGKLIEISDFRFSGTCTVSRENIFAGDQ